MTAVVGLLPRVEVLPFIEYFIDICNCFYLSTFLCSWNQTSASVCIGCLGGGNVRLLLFSMRMKGWMGHVAGVDISVVLLSLLQDPTLSLFVFPLGIGEIYKGLTYLDAAFSGLPLLLVSVKFRYRSPLSAVSFICSNYLLYPPA